MQVLRFATVLIHHLLDVFFFFFLTFEGEAIGGCEAAKQLPRSHTSGHRAPIVWHQAAKDTHMTYPFVFTIVRKTSKIQCLDGSFNLKGSFLYPSRMTFAALASVGAVVPFGSF